VTFTRRLVTSGSPLEPEIGFSRAVRAGPYVCVAGTAPIRPACTFVEVSHFVDPQWLVEFEVDAVIPD
jgi:enamine deaminase RidA (YjgF/YER057c/UK114 family)